MKKEVQFELWQECNSRCSYCSLGIENRCTSEEMKLQSLNTTINELKNSKDLYKVIGFIGGEFFQGQLNTPILYDKFMELMHIVNDMLNKDIVENVWINATMTIGDQKDLWKTLDLFDKKEKLWVLTSYDTIGRFHNKKMFDTWESSINYLHTNYPTIKLNTTSILTEDLIDRYLNDEINFREFKLKYDTALFLKTPVKPDHMCKLSCNDINKILGKFFPTREKFKLFLMKYKMKEGQEEYDNLFSNKLKSEEMRKNYNENELRNVSFIRNKDTYVETLNCDPTLKSIGVQKCGHADIYQCYTNSDGCAVCDKELINNI